MTNKQYILAEQRKKFDAWNRLRYHNHTITGDELAWEAWKTAIVSDRKSFLSELEKDDYQAVLPKHWIRKEIRALQDTV